MQLRGSSARARADQKPTSTTERLGPGGQINAVFALAGFACPWVRGGPVEPNVATVLAQIRLAPHGGDFPAGAAPSPSQLAECLGAGRQQTHFE
jgi:hypothetical protein